MGGSAGFLRADQCLVHLSRRAVREHGDIVHGAGDFLRPKRPLETRGSSIHARLADQAAWYLDWSLFAL